MQEEVGLQSATDGEFRRASWHMDFIYQLGGISKQAGDSSRSRSTTPRATSSSRRRRCTSTASSACSKHDLRRRLPLPAGHRRPTARAEADDPVAEHGPLPRRHGGDRSRRLPRPRRVLGRPHRRLRASEVRRLGELGCTYLQLDDTSLAYLNDPHQREYIAVDRRRPRAPARRVHPPHQRGARGPAGGHGVTTHMCRGNFRSSWAAEGGYDFVAEALFGELEVDGFFMECDDERSGGFEPLRFVPEGQAGRARPRHHEARRARETRTRSSAASRRPRSTSPLDQLCLSPQCGFSSTVEGNDLTVRRAGGEAAPHRRGRRTTSGADLATRCTPRSRRAAGSSRARTSG